MKKFIFFVLFCILVISGISAYATDALIETDPQLHADGGKWGLIKATITDPSLPRVLLIGDSILMGYGARTIKSLEGKANVDVWLNPLFQSEKFNRELAKVLENGPYDVVHFNVGLHGWQEGRIKPGTYEPLTKAIVQIMRDKMPKAKLIWANTTPFTIKGKPTELDPVINAIIIEHNRMAAKVMVEMLVPMNDFYGLLINKLELGRGDTVHWKPEAYPILAKEASKSILRELGITSTAAGFHSVQMESDQYDLHKRIAPAPVDGGFQMADYWVWGSSVIRGDDGQYHMFVSRWPKHLTFHPGWMIASEVVHAVSATPEGPYQFSDVALPARGAQYWDGRSTHNPKILKYKDTYILYYMGSTHPFADFKPEDTLQLNSKYSIVGRSNKRIGIATSKNPYGPWQRNNAPILNTKPDTFYSFLTSNPSPLIKEDGSVLMLFKSRAYRDEFPYHGDMDIGVATAPHYEGPYTVVSNKSIFDIEIEDPTIWRDNQGYHMLAKDQRGEFTGHKGAGIHAVSKDGFKWSIAEPALAYTKEVQWNDGSVVKMGQLERVSVLIEDGVVTHLFFATMDGPGGFGNSTKSWNMVVPLKTE